MTKNKVNSESIDELMSSLTYSYLQVGDSTVTACWSFLPSGFQVGYGQASCIDPDNYDPEIGKKLALEKCIINSNEKLWELEGYRLINS